MKKSTTKSPAAMSTRSMVSNMDTTIMDSPSHINFFATTLPMAQRYDYPTGIKDGIQRKKMKVVYNPDTAPVYDPNQEKSEMEVLDDVDEPSHKSMSKKDIDSGKKSKIDTDVEVFTKFKIGLIMCLSIVSLIIGLISFGLCLMVTLQRSSR